MNASETKIAVKFGLTEADVDELAELGYDTPAKIKAADPEELSVGLASKLARWLQ